MGGREGRGERAEGRQFLLVSMCNFTSVKNWTLLCKHFSLGFS